MAATTAFITGITGMVGSHLADYLIAHTDWDIVGLCRWRSPLDNLVELVPRINRRDRIRLVYGDLRDEHSINEAVRRMFLATGFVPARRAGVDVASVQDIDISLDDLR